MCRFASFKFQPTEDFPVRVADLESHGKTDELLGIKESAYRGDQWRDGHYLPTGEIACNVLGGDSLTAAQCNSAVKARWPQFALFLNWALDQIAPDGKFGGWLDLRGCDLKGVKLPQSVGGSLYLRGCDLKGVKLPQSVGGWLDLSGCDLKGVKLPQSAAGSLYLRGCDLKGVKLPQSVGGSLDLSGCDLKESARLQAELAAQREAKDHA